LNDLLTFYSEKMKTTLLLMIAAFLIISAFGQPVNKKARIDIYQKQQIPQNLQSFLTTGEKLDSTITETWNQSGNTWVFSSRIKYAYTINGYVTTCISSTRDASTSFVWVYSEKDETTVNAKGTTTLYNVYTWDKASNLWVHDWKMEYTINAGEKTTSKMVYNDIIGWDELVNSSKTEYTYDAGGNLISDINYDWDSGTSAWVKKSKTDYTFTAGVVTMEITSNWNGSQWVNSSKTEITYAGGNQGMIISYSWNGSQWVNSSKMDFTYASGKLTVYTVSSWTGGQWVALLKNEFTYGVNIGSSYTITTASMWAVNQWVKNSRSTSWYSAQTSGINEFSEKNIHVYPNPAKEYIVFDLADISGSTAAEIFDIQGKKVMEQRLSENKIISVSKLSKGLYTYKLINSGIIWTGKFIIE
jgi:hypothetical protein